MKNYDILPEALWQEIEPIIASQRKNIGRPPKSPRLMLEGIIYMLESGAQWRLLPSKYGAPSTVHGTWMRWTRTEMFRLIHERMLVLYSEVQPIEPFVVTDTSFSKAPLAKFGGKNPTDRGKRGIKKGIIVDNRGMPIAVSATAANVADLKTIPVLLGKLKNALARSKCAPSHNEWVVMAADGAYGSRATQKLCKDNGIILLAPMNEGPRPRTYRPSRRWIVEPTFSWFHSKFRGIKTCWCKLQITFQACLEFGAALILFKNLGVSG